MSDNQDSPQERKTSTPLEELATGLFDGLPLVKPVRRYIKRKGKKFLQWLSVFLFVCIIVGWRIESTRIDSLKGDITSIKGQLTEVKQDRDKYQIMLSPFQALAMQVYTNVPVDKRLELLSGQFISFQTNLLSIIQLESPSFSVYLNEKLLTNGATLSIKQDRALNLSIINTSKITAEELTVAFTAPETFDVADFKGEFWNPGVMALRLNDDTEIQTFTNNHCWICHYPLSLGANGIAPFYPITISTNRPYSVLGCTLSVHANHSQSQDYYFTVTFN